jgi:phosphoribosylanthranilate isomerase
MIHTRIKVCGITTAADARACCAAGVDYLGVIFAESARRITPERAREIREAVPDIGLVGVFANEDVEDVADTARLSGLDLIQLHGEESPAYCDALAESVSTPVMKAFRNGEIEHPEALDPYRAPCFFLFDLDKNRSNGIGAIRNLWGAAARATRHGRRIFLAGQLTPDNVHEAVRGTAVFGVDVCRGVEHSPGVKDIDALMRFVAEVRR